MRVAFVSLAMRGGMHHYATELVNAYAEAAADEVTLIVPTGADVARLRPEVRLRQIPAPVARTMTVPVAPWLGRPGLSLRLPSSEILRFRSLLRVLDDVGPQVVHLNSGHVWYSLVGRRLSERYCLTATLHDVVPHPGEDSWRRRREVAAVLKWADIIFVHSDELRSNALRVLETSGRRGELPLVETVRHGDYGMFGPIDETLRDGRPTGLFFGRMLAYKGVETLIDAFPLIRAKLPDFRLILAGSGASPALRARIASEPEIEFLDGFVDDARLPSLFGRSDAVVLPYAESSWSGVAALAAHFRRPMIAADVGGLGELVVGERLGLSVAPGEADTLAEAVVRFFTEPGLRLRVEGEIAVRPAASWDAAAARIRAAYQRRVGARGSSGPPGPSVGDGS